MLCTGCLRTQLQTSGTEGGPQPPATPLAPSPLLFASYYYQGHGYYGRGAWGHELLQDPHDFTEADGASLRRAAKGPHFEEDMEGS